MKFYRLLSIILAFLMLFSLSSCTKFDSDYGASEEDTVSNIYKNVKAPDIKSDDEVMPTFFDISLFDEENYSAIYLGKKYEYKFLYAGNELTLPAKLSYMNKGGWEIVDKNTYNEDTNINAGKSLKVSFVNNYGKELIVQFYNPKKSSVALKDCKIVKYIIPENNYISADSKYGQFFINGVSNDSAITDVIEFLGAPSHFYAVSANLYYLDYFLTEKDKREKIRIYVDASADNVTAVEISKY